MKVALDFTNEHNLLPSIKAFVGATLANLPLPDDIAPQLASLTIAVVERAIEQAYPAGEEGTIRIEISEQQGKLQIIVRDYGLPRDIARDEQALLTVEEEGGKLFGCHVQNVADEMHWIGYGSQGKAFQVTRWLHDRHVAETSASSDIAAFDQQTKLAPEQSYEIHRLRHDDAVQVSRLIYRAYGATYFNKDVYYPERLIAQNEHGTLISFVAVAANGEVVGNYALELEQPGPVVEVGQAVVHPAHRQRGLLGRMKDAALEHAQQMNLAGWYADAVCVHTYTQQSNVEHGGKLAGVNLGIAPRGESFRGLSEQQPERVTALLYFHWLQAPACRQLHVSERHQEIVARIYDNLNCPIEFGAPQAPTARGAISTRVVDGARRAVIRVVESGAEVGREICHARRELVEHGQVEVVFADLPLVDSGTPSLIEELEAAGFGFAGIAPHFAAQGDIVRMIYLVEMLTKGPINVYETFGEQLLEYVLSEQARVRATL